MNAVREHLETLLAKQVKHPVHPRVEVMWGEPRPQPPLSLPFTVGDRVSFHYTPKSCRSGIIYDVGPTTYAVTLIFGRNHVNVGVPHEACWKR